MGVDQLPRRDWTGTPVLIGIGWTMRRPRRAAVSLALYTHAVGWELRLEGQHAFPRSRICQTKEEVAIAAEEWQQMLEIDGWTSDAS
jgi:hypothetical protein